MENISSQADINLKLESIFLPSISKKRFELYDKNEFYTFAHYTSADSALKIINSKCLWMRNATAMSDYSEVQHGFNLMNNFLINENNKKKFSDSIDKLDPNLTQKAIDKFNTWWNDIRFNTFIASLSEHPKHDDPNGKLSMWRAFGAGKPSVALILKIPKYSEIAKKLNLMFVPAMYTLDLSVEFNQVVTNIKNNDSFLKKINKDVIFNWVFNMFVIGATCTKHKAFSEENEWRVIYGPNRNKSQLISSGIETIKNIPQQIYKLPLDNSIDDSLTDINFNNIFDKLIIGPSEYPWPMSQGFIEALSKAGVSNALDKVILSGIPIRN